MKTLPPFCGYNNVSAYSAQLREQQYIFKENDEMKKSLSIILVSLLAVFMTSCGSVKDASSSAAEESSQAVTVEETLPEVPIEAENDDSDEVSEETENGDSDDSTETADGTVGEVLLADFREIVKSGSSSTPAKIAEQLVTNHIIADYSMVTMEVQEGLLNGFDNNEIKGFSQGCSFAPMIGSIPFVGYVFQLEDGSDAGAFMDTLKSSANLRWNVCVEADEMTCENVDNYVFFLMSPKSLDE